MSATTTRSRSTLAMPRSRGFLTGLCLLALGVWGGLIAFIGPYFNYAIGPNHAWHFTYGRLWLDILPGAAAALGGLLLLAAGNRITAAFAGWLAAAAGAWFVIGPQVSRFWNHGVAQTGTPFGGHVRQTFEWLGYHYALGALVLLFAGFAIGRASLTAARDVLPAQRGRGFRRRRRAVAEPVTTGEPVIANRRPAGRERVAAGQRAGAGEGQGEGGAVPAGGGDVPA